MKVQVDVALLQDIREFLESLTLGFDAEKKRHTWGLLDRLRAVTPGRDAMVRDALERLARGEITVEDAFEAIREAYGYV